MVVRLDLLHLINAYPHEFDGDRRQCIGIARAPPVSLCATDRYNCVLQRE